MINCRKSLLENFSQGRRGGLSVERLPSARVMIPGSWDWALRRAPCSVGSLLLPLSLCLSLSVSNKEI